MNDMKKILEVLQYGEHELRFNTDIDVKQNPEAVHEIIVKAVMTMATKLWGGNEISVLAMIRALSIADLTLSVNRKDMVKHLDRASADYAATLKETEEEMRKHGIDIVKFPPGVQPSDQKS